MPIGFTSAARNLFLLGSAGADLVTNFFKTIDQSSSTDGVFTARDIKYLYSEERYLLAGLALNSQGKSFGFHEKRQQNGTEDWSVKTQSTDPNNNVTLTSLELDSNGNLIVGGLANSAPWIARYTTAGVLQWTSTTNTGNGRYFGLAVDSDDNYYGAGRTKRNNPLITDDGFRSSAILEKYDNNGNTVWGKSVSVTGENVCFNKVDATSTSIIAAGYLGDGIGKGYFAKFDKSSGEMQWDRTLVSNVKTDLGIEEATSIEDIHVDPDGNIYLCGTLFLADSEDDEHKKGRGFVIKYSAEGNLLWQQEVGVPDYTAFYQYYNINVDDNTRQVIVFGRTYASSSTYGAGLLTKLSSSGKILWNRRLLSDRVPPTLNHFSRRAGFDADPSFYYVFFTDDNTNLLNGTPDEYTFGKVSSSGNGLGAFQYEPQTGINIDYEIINPATRIGKLQDGSIRNDSSDLTSYPFSGLKVSFDDYATPIANKKAILSDKDLVQRSGSPAVRPVDFETREFTTDGYGVPPQKNYIGLSESLQPTSTSNTGTTNNTWSRQTTNTTITANNLSNPLGVGSGAEKYNISATTGRRLEYGVPSGVFVAGQTYTYSWWMKAITTDARWNFQALNAGSSNNSIRIADRYGNILENLSTTNTTNYKPKDTEWHRVVWTFTANNTTGSPIGGYNDNSETGDLWYLWGAQLVDGPNPLPYYRNYNGSPENADGTEHAPSIVDGAYEFDGSEILQIGPVPEIGDEFTVEIWFKSNTHSNWQNPIDCNYGSQDLLGNGLVNSGNIGPRLEINASGTFAWVFGSTLAANDPFFATPAGTGSTGVWYHSVLTYGGGGATDGKSYLNGEYSNQSTTTGGGGGGWVGEFRNVILGRGFTLATRYFDGQIGEVRIYPKALTAAQVFQNYNATKSRYTSEVPDTAPKIGPGIVYDSNLLLNYDFGNRATYDSFANRFDLPGNLITETEVKILPSDGAGGDNFGHCVSVGSDRIVVGAPFDDDNADGSGSAYIYNLDGTGEIKLTASDAAEDDNFGYSVAVGNNRVVVGAYYKDTRKGSAYIFDLNGNELATLTAPVPDFSDFFGYTVAVGNNRIVVGSPRDDDNQPNSGSAYIYDLNGNLITQITASDYGHSDEFGYSVSVGNNRIVVGATNDDDNGSDTGSAYIFDLNGNELFKITASDGSSSNRPEFGYSVAVGNDRIVVGAPFDDDGETDSGSAYVFDLDGNQLAKLTVSGGFVDNFGWSVAVGNNKIIVGASGNDDNGFNTGLVYVFDLDGNLLTKISPADAAVSDLLGRSVAVGNDTIVVGALGNDDNGSNSGSAYRYKTKFSLPTTVKNLSSGSYNGTINGATFNSDDGYFDFGTTSEPNLISTTGTNCSTLLGSGSCSIECWVKFDDTFTRQTIISGYVSLDAARWDLEVSSGSISFIHHENGTTTQGSGGVSATSWSHIAVTRTGQNVEMYINGTANGSSLNGGSIGSAVPLGIGCRADGSTNFPLDGQIGQVRTYTKALSAAEVSQNFNATRGKYGV